MAREHTASVLWAGLVTALLLSPPKLLSRPGLSTAAGLPFADKAVHLALFAVQGLLLARSLRRLGVERPMLVASLVSICLGGLIELVQPYMARSCELGDLLADGAGAFLASAIRGSGGRANRRD